MHNQPKKGGGGRRKRKCDPQCKVCLNDGAMIVAARLLMHASPSWCRMARCHTIGWKVVSFRTQKKKKKAAWRKTMVRLGSLLSLSLPPLFSFLSLSLSLSLPPFLPFSLSLSLPPPPHSLSNSKGTHTQTLLSQCPSLRWGHCLCIQLHPAGWVRFVEHSNSRKHA